MAKISASGYIFILVIDSVSAWPDPSVDGSQTG